jgi:hypothetical protein
MNSALRILLPLTVAAGAFFAAREIGVDSSAPGAAVTTMPNADTPPAAQARPANSAPTAAPAWQAVLDSLPRDPVAAMQAFRQFSLRDRKTASEKLIALLLKGDPALTALLLPYLDEFVDETSVILVQNERIREAVEFITTLPEGKSRTRLLEQTMRRWVFDDWKSATAWAAAKPEPDRSALTAHMATAILQNGSARESWPWAANWLTHSASRAQRQKLGTTYAAELARTSPAAALEWAQANLAGGPCNTAIGSALAAAAAQDPAGARALVEQMPPGGARSSAAFSVVQAAPDEASVRWLVTQAKAGSSQWIQVAGRWAEREPDAYRKFMVTEKEEDIPKHFVCRGIEALSAKDAAGTVEWAVQTEREYYATISLEKYSDQDPLAAAQWISAHPEANIPENAVWIAADRNFTRNPIETAEWAIALPEGSRRNAAVSRIREMAEKATNLPAVERVHLLQLLTQGGN